MGPEPEKPCLRRTGCQRQSRTEFSRPAGDFPFVAGGLRQLRNAVDLLVFETVWYLRRKRRPAGHRLKKADPVIVSSSRR